MGAEARAILRSWVEQSPPKLSAAPGLDEWEEYELRRIHGDESISETDREAVILARRGQGRFKEDVMRIERACRITGVNRIEHLRASHCKPWRDATNDERLDGENGLLLTPSVDHLFDRGFIGFEDNGDVIVSPVAHGDSLRRMGLDTGRAQNVGGFTSGQRRYLEFHRENILLMSRYIPRD